MIVIDLIRTDSVSVWFVLEEMHDAVGGGVRFQPSGRLPHLQFSTKTSNAEGHDDETVTQKEVRNWFFSSTCFL